jgi:photosystem II stability/assembly factor-like uncharacterized protein
MKRLILLELILLFLATTFRSDSAGGWVQQILPRTDVTVQDIFFIDSLTGHIVVRKNTNDSAFIFKTIDAGSNWTTSLQDNIYLTTIQFVNNNTGFSVGSAAPSGIIKKTTNAGQNWFTISTIGAYPIWDLSFINEDSGWICSDDLFAGGIFKTTNGGLNWQQQLGASFSIKKLFMLNKDTGWAGSNEANGKLYRTINGGGNWNLQYSFPTTTGDIFFINNDTGFISGNFVPNAIRMTTNGGFNWDSTSNSQGAIDIFFVNKVIGYSCANFSIIQKTTNGGLSWFRQTVPSGFYNSIMFTDTSKGWSGGTILIHTNDGGGPPLGIHPVSGEIPSEYNLYQNYPNPFNPITVISYQLRVSSYVKMTVYDIMGKEIAVLVNQKQNTGTYRVDFNGSGYSSGVYFYQFTIDNEIIDTKKMLMIK